MWQVYYLIVHIVIVLFVINSFIIDFTADHVIVNILFATTPTTGDQFNMTCNISIPERLVHDLTRLAVIWSYDLARVQRVDVINSDATIGNVTKIGNLILSNLTLNPVKTSDGRRYYCSVIFNDLGVYNHTLRDLSVQSKLFGQKSHLILLIHFPQSLHLI